MSESSARRILGKAMGPREPDDPQKAFETYVRHVNRGRLRERLFGREHLWRDVGVLLAIFAAATGLRWWFGG